MRAALLVAALLVLAAVVESKFILQDSYNGNYTIGPMTANKWEQTNFTITSAAAGVPLSAMYFFFADASSSKPIPSSYFQRASISLTTSNQSLTVYNALTDSLGTQRVFGNYPFVIPKGTLTVKATWALNVGQPTITSAVIMYYLTQATSAAADPVSRLSLFVPTLSNKGVSTASVTASIPYSAMIIWASGNVLSGGQTVVLSNNATGAVICSSSVDSNGDFIACTTPTQVAGGTKLTVTVTANTSYTPNTGGIDLYVAKLPAPATTASATHATVASATHATASVSTTHSSSSGPSSSGPSSSGPSSSGPSSSHTSGPSSSGPSSSGPSSSGPHTSSSGPSSSGPSSSGPSSSHTSGPSSSGPSSSGPGSSGPGSSGPGSSGPGSSGPSSSGPGSSGPASSSSGKTNGQTSGQSNGQSDGQTTGQSNGQSTTQTNGNGVTMGYSSGSSGNGGGSSSGGFLANSIFRQGGKKNSIVINDIKHEQSQNVLEIAEIDELPNGDAEHFRILEEKSSNKFL